MTLFPSPFPRSCWKEAREVQKLFNELYARISADEEWLGRIVEEYVDISFPLLPVTEIIALHIGILVFGKATEWLFPSLLQTG